MSTRRAWLIGTVCAAVATGALTGTAAASDRDAGQLFVPGANICKLVSSAAMDKAVGVTFPSPVMSGRACFWQTGKFGDLNRTIVRVSTLPGLPKANTDATVALEKKAGAAITKVSLPGAAEAVVSSSKLGPTVTATVYGVYPQGELVASLTGNKLTVAKAVAAARVAVS